MTLISKEDSFPIVIFLIWRTWLFIPVLIATNIIPTSGNFLGGGLQNYESNPFFWLWGNFDGEHYLSIARQGYLPLTYFFFPLFPLLARYLSSVTTGSIANLHLSGLVISNTATLISLIILFRLSKEVAGKISAKYSVAILLLFPTSFFLVSYYTESLYLALALTSFYLLRRDKILGASIAAGVSTAARIVGISILPSAFLYMLIKKFNIKKYLVLIFAPSGILIYMYYLRLRTGNPLEFISTIDIFGPQRSEHVILLPQVFYRYIFKILPNIDLLHIQSSFPILLEFSTALIVLVTLIFNYKKIPLELVIYSIASYLIPSFSGSFSSFSRYVLAIFPIFILWGSIFSKTTKIVQVLTFTILFICQAVALAFFSRGYWIA